MPGTGLSRHSGQAGRAAAGLGCPRAASAGGGLSQRAGADAPFQSAGGASMRYVLALDQGTTGSAALVLDEAGEVVASADREIAQSYPRPGWVEHDPEEIF